MAIARTNASVFVELCIRNPAWVYAVASGAYFGVRLYEHFDLGLEFRIASVFQGLLVSAIIIVCLFIKIRVVFLISVITLTISILFLIHEIWIEFGAIWLKSALIVIEIFSTLSILASFNGIFERKN